MASGIAARLGGNVHSRSFVFARAGAGQLNEIIDRIAKKEHVLVTTLTKRLENLMMEHSKNLESEKAAQVRDQLHLLKEQLFGAPGEDKVVSITGK